MSDKERKEFDVWWDGDIKAGSNPFRVGSPAFWAWEGWQARAALAQQAVPEAIKETIDKLLADAMNTAVSNGANSVSMPDEYVALAAWLAAAPAAPQAEQQSSIPADFVREFQIERAWKLGYTYGRDAEFVTHEDEAWGRRAANVIAEIEDLAAPQADNWSQYATERETTAQQVIERHRAEHGSLLRLLAKDRATIAELRAQQVEREPVGEILEMDDGSLVPVWRDGTPPAGTKLYVQQAESPQEPLTVWQIANIEAEIWNLDFMDDTERRTNMEFARIIERTLATRWGVKLKGSDK